MLSFYGFLKGNSGLVQSDLLCNKLILSQRPWLWAVWRVSSWFQTDWWKQNSNVRCFSGRDQAFISGLKAAIMMQENDQITLNVMAYKKLEIKPCGLGSRIRDMEADFIYWWTFRLLFISFGKQNWHCGMDNNVVTT